MRFSVLLPTRNGGAYLENCIRSILEQGYEDMELVISDNANSDETPAVIARYAADPRVKTARLEQSVSVTENWNNALRLSSGDYILMMGDDDYLLPGYFTRMDEIIERHGRPDCVLYNGYSYVAPGSIDGNRDSYYGESHFHYEPALACEQRLSVEQRHGIVRDMFRFKVRIPLNMQTTLVSRQAAGKIKGGLFHPPFPDHYALNSLLLLAGNWIVVPDKLVVVGVSPKSFGHYVYSNQQNGGLAYLGISSDFPDILPGNEMINAMHVWLNKMVDSYPDFLKGVKVDRPGYVRRQAYAWYMQRRLGGCSTKDFLRRFSLLSLGDWMGLVASLFDAESWSRLGRMAFSRKRGRVEAQWHGLRPVPEVKDIHQFSCWLQQRPCSSE